MLGGRLGGSGAAARSSVRDVRGKCSEDRLEESTEQRREGGVATTRVRFKQIKVNGAEARLSGSGPLSVGARLGSQGR